MKRIMFNDKYGLTKAVLEGRKTMTRRIVPEKQLMYIRHHFPGLAVVEAPYKVGEVVAVAQSYKDVMEERGEFGVSPLVAKAGYRNKMFVKADLMPHRIRITNIRVERLKDISDEDCFREGVRRWKDCPDCPDVAKNFPDELYEIPGSWDAYLSPRKAFASLIDKVSGKGTWASNPWVFVYEFELVK